jgi:tetratricopeptide (TPR) repeat protein
MSAKKNLVSISLVLVACALVSACASAGKPSTEAAASPRGKVPDEKNPQYQYEKGLIALNYGLVDEAVKYGEVAVGLDPGHYKSWLLLGSAFFSKGEFERSIEAYEKAVALKPGEAEAHKYLGLARLELKDYGRAEASLKQAAALREEADTLFQLGKACHLQGKNEEALAYAERSIRKEGKNPLAYNLKGVVLNQLGRYAEAVGAFSAGLVLAPEDIALQVNLGIAYINANELKKGEEILEKVLPKIQDAALRARVQNYLDSIREER